MALSRLVDSEMLDLPLSFLNLVFSSINKITLCLPRLY